jgi:hypothetical protein
MATVIFFDLLLINGLVCRSFWHRKKQKAPQYWGAFVVNQL